MKHREFRRVPLRDHDGMPHGMGVLDLASSGNAYGPSPAVITAIGGTALAGYPHPTARPAREAIAQRFRTAAERVVLGNGAFDLLWTAARVLLRHGDTVLTIEPGSHELAAAARQLGARVVQWRAVERTEHRVQLDQVEALMTLERPVLVGVCAPSTPTGAAVPFADLQALAARFADTYFIVDQSLLALSDDHAELEHLPPPNMLCIRSLGKELGVCGLRVGYCITDAVLAERMESARPSFTVSAPAQSAALAAMQEPEFLAGSRELLFKDRDRLAFVLSKLGLTYTPSVAPFLMVRMARAAEVAHELLTEHAIATLECSAYGLPDHLRISGLDEAAERPFEVAMRKVMERRKLTRGRER